MDIKRGIIKGFDSGTYKATVQIAGSLSVWLSEVAVARNIPATEMVIGCRCAVIFFDETNPGDAVVVGIYT